MPQSESNCDPDCEVDDSITSTTGDQQTNSDFQNKFFTLTLDDVQKSIKSRGQFDIIIVGTGIGGGVLAGDLFDTNSKLGPNAKNILVIEKGDLVFHSHCLNTSRPAGLGRDRGQQNDTFFSMFKDDYNLINTDKDDWKGGPMYNLGGRSAAWGLFAPRIHTDTLTKHFPESVRTDLRMEYYPKAEKLMNLSLPVTKPIHQHVMERLNMGADPKLNAQWEWGRIASEFHDDRNFDFAEGAYSPIDKLLEIAMSKPVGKDGKMQEHQNFKMLLGTEVHSISLPATRHGDVAGVVVNTSSGEVLIRGKVVVLCAGSVGSAAILLPVWSNSNPPTLTDHDIIHKSQSFRYRDPNARLNVGAMKLQTYVYLPNAQEYALCNMSIDASSFLPRGPSQEDDLPRFIMTVIFQEKLSETNFVSLGGDGKVEVTINRGPQNEDRKKDLEVLASFTETARSTISEVLKLDFVGDPTPNDSHNYFGYLELGAVAHELGTLPMPSPSKTHESSVDENLALKGTNNLYICDLSVFPVSPEVNPTVTLAALALRLSAHLSPLDDSAGIAPFLRVVNYSGKPIKIWVSNYSGVYEESAVPSALGPGESKDFSRTKDVVEAVFVFRHDQAAKDDPKSPYKDWTYLTTPEFWKGEMGKLTAIEETFTGNTA